MIPRQSDVVRLYIRSCWTVPAITVAWSVNKVHGSTHANAGHEIINGHPRSCKKLAILDATPHINGLSWGSHQSSALLQSSRLESAVGWQVKFDTIPALGCAISCVLGKYLVEVVGPELLAFGIVLGLFFVYLLICCDCEHEKPVSRELLRHAHFWTNKHRAF